MTKGDDPRLQWLMLKSEMLRNYWRIARWPGALAIALSLLCHQAVYWAGGPLWARFAVGFCTAFAAMWWLLSRAYLRALWRKWNRLEA